MKIKRILSFTLTSILVLLLTVSNVSANVDYHGNDNTGWTGGVPGAVTGYPIIVGEGVFVSWAVGPKDGIIGVDYNALNSMNGFLYYKASHGLRTSQRRSGLTTKGSFSKTYSSSAGGIVAGWPMPSTIDGATNFDQFKTAISDSTKFAALCAELGIPNDTIDKCLAANATESIYIAFQPAIDCDTWPRPSGGPGWMSPYDYLKVYGYDLEVNKVTGTMSLVNNVLPDGWGANKHNDGYWNAGVVLVSGTIMDATYEFNGVRGHGYYVITSADYAGAATVSGHKLVALPDDKEVTVNPSTEPMTLTIKPDAANINTTWAALGNPASANLNWTVSTNYSGVTSSSLSGTIPVTKATLATYLSGSGSIDCTPSTKPTVQVKDERVVVPWNSTLTLVAGAKTKDLGSARDNASFNPTAMDNPATQSWRSQPNAMAEIKNRTYSMNRSSEEWDAMAGLPHTETLYVDVGASGISAALQAQKVTQAGMTSSASHSDSRSHTELVKCSESGCSTMICKWCGNSSTSCSTSHQKCGTCCSGHTRPGPPDAEGNPTTESYTDSCGNACRTGSHTVWTQSNSQSFSFKDVAGTGLTMYEMYAWDIESPTEATQAASFLAGSPVSMSAPLSGSWAKTEKGTTFVGWPSSPGVYTCNPSENARWLQDSKDKVQAALASIQVGIRTPSATITDRQGKTYRPMVSSHFQWRGVSLSGTTITFEPFNGNPYSLNRVTTNTVWGPGSPVSGEMRTNFRPIEESWDPYDHFQIIGYNGKYGSPSSRRTGAELFYRGSISISPTQTNGRKPAGATNVSYSQVAKQGSYNAIVNTTDVSYGPGSEYQSSANAVTIHTPVAISRFEIEQDNYILQDQRINPSTNPWKIYVDDWFKVTLDYEWHSSNNGGLRSLSRSTRHSGNTSDYLGPGYNSGMDTKPWIRKVEIRFPYEVVYNSIRRPANVYFEIPKTVNTHYFYLPLSEREVANAQPTVRVTATNAGSNEQAGGTPHDNYARNFGDVYTAAHAITVTQVHDIIGRIGNFVVEHIGDPNWMPLFRQGITGQWLINGVVPKTNKVPINYIGPFTDMFGWLTKNKLNLATYGYLDRWGTVPTLHKRPWLNFPIAGGKLKYPSPYNNITAVTKEPVKIGYPIYFSLQTAGNYGEPGVSVKVNPTFVLRHKSNGTTIKNFHMYVKSGSKYIKFYDTTNKAYVNPAYPFPFTVQMGNELLNINASEREKTTYRNSLSDMVSIGNVFDKLNIYKIGGVQGITLTQQQRTNIGSSTTNATIWSVGGASTLGGSSARTERDHERQGQRWHGMFMIPSSTVFVVNTGGSKVELFDTEDYVLDVHLGIETGGGTPWNLKESEYWAQFGSEPRVDQVDPPWGPPEHPNDDVVITFDPNKRAVSDVTSHGTH